MSHFSDSNGPEHMLNCITVSIIGISQQNVDSKFSQNVLKIHEFCSELPTSAEQPESNKSKLCHPCTVCGSHHMLNKMCHFDAED